MNKRDTLAAAALGAGCLGRSHDDEPVFVLCARDPFAPGLVRDWAIRHEAVQGAGAKSSEAFVVADQMDAWYARGTTRQFRVGDVVMVKGQGQKMTVNAVLGVDLVSCRWFQGAVLNETAHSAHVLKLAE